MVKITHKLSLFIRTKAVRWACPSVQGPGVHFNYN
jgi:hypothetical protein